MIHPREKISFIRVTSDQDDTGQLVNTEMTYYTPKAVSVQELRSSLETIAQQGNIVQGVKVKMRYNPENEILNGDFIEWRGFRFTNLTFKVDPYRRFIEIMALSEIETTNRNSDQS